MDEKILLQVNDHVKKFGYTLTSSEKEEMIELYELNNESYEPRLLTLHIEKYVESLKDRHVNKWIHERRQSVCAQRVNPSSYIMPNFTKEKETFDFLIARMSGEVIPFSLLTHDLKASLVNSMYPLVIKKDTILIQQGDIGNEMYIIETGEFDVLVDGKVQNKLYPGDRFGELALLHEIPRTATVLSVKDSKIWAAEQASFSCIRIRDMIFKKNFIGEALAESKEIPLFLKSPESIQRAVAVSTNRCYPEDTEIKLGGEEILVIFKNCRVRFCKEGSDSCRENWRENWREGDKERESDSCRESEMENCEIKESEGDRESDREEMEIEDHLPIDIDSHAHPTRNPNSVWSNEVTMVKPKMIIRRSLRTVDVLECARVNLRSVGSYK